MLVNPSFIHYNYDDLDTECGCFLCTGYFQARKSFQAARDATVEHKWRCSCDLCRHRRKSYMTLLATANKRDTYSELSFLAHDKRDGDAFLAWMIDKVSGSNFKGLGWWANHSAKLTLGWWIEKWGVEVKGL